MPDLYAILCKQIGYEETENDWKYYEGARDKSLRRFAAEEDATSQHNLMSNLNKNKHGSANDSAYLRQSASNYDIFHDLEIQTIAEVENEPSTDLTFTSTKNISRMHIDVDSISNTSTVARNANFNKTFSNMQLSLTPQRSVKEKLNQLLMSPMPGSKIPKNHTFFASTPVKTSISETFSPAGPSLVKQLDDYNESVRCMLAEGNSKLVSIV